MAAVGFAETAVTVVEAVAVSHNNPNAVAVANDVADTTAAANVADYAVVYWGRQRDAADTVADGDVEAEMWPLLRALDKRVCNGGLNCLNAADGYCASCWMWQMIRVAVDAAATAAVVDVVDGGAVKCLQTFPVYCR